MGRQFCAVVVALGTIERDMRGMGRSPTGRSRKLTQRSVESPADKVVGRGGCQISRQILHTAGSGLTLNLSSQFDDWLRVRHRYRHENTH